MRSNFCNACAKARLTQEHTEVRIILDEELRLKLQKIKLLVSHQNPSPTYAELLLIMAEMVLKKLDPESHKCRVVKNAAPQAATTPHILDTTRSANAAAAAPRQLCNLVGNFPTLKAKPIQTLVLSKAKRSRTISRDIRKQVWIRDRGKCTYADPKSGQICGSQFQVQLDHRIAFAKGGLSTLENLRCLCSHHNKLLALQDFGVKKMQDFFCVF